MSEKSKSFKNSRPKVFIKTFGCQMNVHDSEKIAGIFSEAGYKPSESVNDADVIVINTCGVREKAEQKFYSELGRLKSVRERNPKLKIAVAGCIAQQRGEYLFERFPYVDFIFGPNNIDSLGKWLNPVSSNAGQGTEHPRRFATRSFTNAKQGTGTGANLDAGAGRTQTTALGNNPEYHTKTLPLKREGQVRAWVSIMYGCDNFCSYCVVPYTRGRERSRPNRDIIREVQDIANQGFKEITLLGQNVNSYGRNLEDKIDFPDLLKVIHDVSGIERIRFVTSHPRDLTEKLIEYIRDLPKICEHIHLPIQAGSGRILSLMNRGYTFRKYKEKIDLLRNAIPDIAITTDIITGFPGETDEDFKCTINALKDIEFDGIFAFKYSRRSDTKALTLPDHIDENIKSERLSIVLDLQESITYKKNKTLEGKTVEVLVEGPSETDKDKLTGRTRTNKIVNFYGDNEFVGKLIDLKILEAKMHSLFGEIVSV